MQTVRIDKSTLKRKLIENRARHREIFLEAQEGFRACAIRELDKILSDARAGARIQNVWSMVAPIDQTREYDRVLAMIDMTLDDSIELSERDFARYVLDQWEWHREFIASNARYSKIAADSIRDE